VGLTVVGVCVCVKRRASSALFVELLSMVLEGGFRNISLERSASNDMWGRVDEALVPA
jgi:hypothetical protein